MDAVEDEAGRFSEDESNPIIDLEAPPSEDEVPDFEMIDNDREGTQAIAAAQRELVAIAKNLPSEPFYGEGNYCSLVI